MTRRRLNQKVSEFKKYLMLPQIEIEQEPKIRRNKTWKPTKQQR